MAVSAAPDDSELEVFRRGSDDGRQRAEAPDADLIDRRPVCGGVDVIEGRAGLRVLVDRSLSF